MAICLIGIPHETTNTETLVILNVRINSRILNQSLHLGIIKLWPFEIY